MAAPNGHHDVIVVGLGAWGSATLAQLAQRGLRVLGTDQFTPPHRRGSHHGQGRIIRMASAEAAFYTPMMTRSYELWRDTERRCGQQLLTIVGGIFAAPPDHEIVAGTLASYRNHDIAHEVFGAAAARRRFPWITFEDDEVVVFEPGAGRLHPELSIRAHLAIAAWAGAHVESDNAMTGWEAGPNGVTVTTLRGTYTCDRLVLTLGPWALDYIRLSLPLVVERQAVAVYDAASIRQPLTVILLPASEGESFYGLPEDGDTFKVALHHGGLTGHPDSLPAAVTDDDRGLLRHYVARRLPSLPAEPLEVFTCKYTNTPDRHFILGYHPAHPAVVVGAGCSGRGFKFSPFIGEALADLATDTRRTDLDPFSPLRFAERDEG
jgi:sarcosine oxidase